ncbi:choice-of-anchor B family protein [Sphingobacteriales bacterium UPWRP_1]|nr:hypothetical protein B6N25_02060 [Sphingobacteriales bacterium TSM_CSS]PSJ75341.1 choice-of-anchor B family protein [Sphingobacteriales bacterium UPWRP_1]
MSSNINFALKLTFTLLCALLLAGQQAAAQYNLTFRDQIDYPQNVNDVWGYVSSSGTEYALVGTQTGISIVNVSNPDNITEVQFIAGVDNTWRDVDVWQNRAYVVTESSTAGGLLVIDLSNLPVSAPSAYTQMGFGFTTAHTIWIDENGIGYLFGANSSGMGSGTFMVNIAANPANPTYLGKYSAAYVHDGFVRNDTLWSGEIYAGRFGVVNVTNKSAPAVMATQSTPNAFTHNTWTTNNGDYLFTTDEVNNSYVTAYNVSDITNITEIDRYQHEPGSGVIPHNVYVKNNFLIIAYYTAGVTIVDATYPNNLIEVAHYDTSPFSGGGFNGVWAAYGWLPSGNILVTDRQQGLFVLTPTYVQACYLQGMVSNAVGGAAIPNATIQLLGVAALPATTNFTGHYATGAGIADTYDVVVSAPGFYTDTVTVALTTPGVITTLNVSLLPDGPCAIPPGNLTASNITDNSVTLSWTATPGANSYNVQYRKSGTATWTTATTSGTTINLSGLSDNTSYEVQVQANCGSGYLSAFSGIVSFNTPPSCPAPGGLSVSNITPYSAKLQWNAIFNVVGYTLQYRQAGAATWQQTTTSNNFFTLSNLLPCTGYEFRVFSNCGSGINSAWSVIFGFSTATPAFSLANATLATCQIPLNLNTLLTGTGGGTWTGGSHISGNLFNPTGLASGQYPAIYTISGTNCTVSDTSTVTVTPAPDAAFTDTTVLICNGALDLNTLLTGTGTGGGTWTGGGYIAGNFFVPDALNPGLYAVTYTVGSGSCQTLFTRQLQVAYCPLGAKVTALLQGAYMPPDSMRTRLRQLNLLPLQQPYNQPPWNYNGTETATQFAPNVVDWVLLELRNAADNTQIVAQKAALLLKDGTIADVNGNAESVFFDNLPPNTTYYIALRHRNHLPVMSAVPVTLPNSVPYNFSTAAQQAMGTNQQIAVALGVFALKAADFNANGIISVADFNLYFLQTSATGQYSPADAELNGSVTISDFNLYAGNRSAIGIAQLRY